MSLLVWESAIKVSLILLPALLALVLLRRQSAALRHWVLAVAIACAAIVPLTEVVMPGWQVPFSTPSWGSSAARPTGVVTVSETVTTEKKRDPVHVTTPAERGTGSVFSASSLALVWFLGMALGFSILATGLARLAWLRSRARPVAHGRWTEVADDVARRYGLRRAPLLLQSDHPTLLATWGVVRPKVMLPRGASAWSEDRMRVVLYHELAHVQRGDWVVQMLAELMRSVYWFNPLLWLACRRLGRESEHACDEVVLAEDIEGADYATHLLDVARALNTPRQPWLPASAMARPCDLERRIRTMLTARVGRPLTRSVRLVSVLLLLGITIPIAAAQSSRATFSGSVRDPFGALVPDATLILSNVQSQTTHEVRSDESGQFAFLGLPAGTYDLDVEMAGFKRLQQEVILAGQDVERDLTLEVGSLQETITVSGPASGARDIRAADPSPARGRVVQQEARLERALTECDGVATGGRIHAPEKLQNAQPHYPQALRDAGIEGTVVLEGRIGTDGSVQDVRVLGAVHPDLDREAINAVSQWRFSTTLLNCEPIDVLMTVTIDFSIEQ